MSKKGGKGEKPPLEKRLYDAKMSPDPKFDLSDCNLTIIPDGIFSMCKILRKDALYLHNNQLKALANGGPMDTLLHLKVLDISNNKFEKLPSDLNLLESLEILNVSQNQLRHLPDSIGSLSQLNTLIASNNNLVELPESLGNCSKLEILSLKNNRPLRRLPLSLCKLQYLWELTIDPTIVFPPKDVCEEGIQAIMSYLSNELKNSSQTLIQPSIIIKSAPDNSKPLQNELEQLEQQKKKKQMEMLNSEKINWENRDKETALEQEQKKKQERLIKGVQKLQKTIDEKISKVQEEKNAERGWLLNYFLKEEGKSEEVVGKILDANKKLRSEAVEALEDEKKKEEEWLSKTFPKISFEKKQILIRMEQDLKAEIDRVQRTTDQKRVFVIRSLVTELLLQDNALRVLTEKSTKSRERGVETMQENEAFHKAAVASMLERSDDKSWKLAKQIAIVQEELAGLTKLEIVKRKLQSESHNEELQKSRIALTEELMRLFKEQDERRRKLVETIRKMEVLKEDSATFWLEQYEKLKNSKSRRLVEFLETVDPVLAHQLYLNGALQFLPLLKDINFSKENLQNLNGSTLSKVGINAKDRQAIFKSIKTFLELVPPSTTKLEEQSARFEKVSSTKVKKPSQTKLEDPSSTKLVEPSAPPMPSPDTSQNYSVPEECVVCLEKKPNAVFIPCGHICCCEKCCRSLVSCPLCRQPIAEIYETNY